MDTDVPEIETDLEIDATEDLMLTTIDNPFNPKEDYAKWRLWDADNGYNTEEFLVRMMDIPSNVDIDDVILMKELSDKAIQEILEHDVLQVYKLI